MHTISSYHGNRHTHTHTQTNPQTGPITIHCAAKLSAQCNDNTKLFLCAEDVKARLADDLREQLQEHVVVCLLHRALIVDLQWTAFMHVVLLLIYKAATYSTISHYYRTRDSTPRDILSAATYSTISHYYGTRDSIPRDILSVLRQFNFHTSSRNIWSKHVPTV